MPRVKPPTVVEVAEDEATKKVEICLEGGE
jgi:hypothetical protein